MGPKCSLSTYSWHLGPFLNQPLSSNLFSIQTYFVRFIFATNTLQNRFPTCKSLYINFTSWEPISTPFHPTSTTIFYHNTILQQWLNHVLSAFDTLPKPRKLTNSDQLPDTLTRPILSKDLRIEY